MPSETKDVGPIHDDILIAKMRPGILFPFPSKNISPRKITQF